MSDSLAERMKYSFVKRSLYDGFVDRTSQKISNCFLTIQSVRDEIGNVWAAVNEIRTRLQIVENKLGIRHDDQAQGRY